MESARELWRRMSSLWRGRHLENGLDAEMAFHLEQLVQKHRQAGKSPEQARRAALAEFGGVARAKEAAREEFRPLVLDDLGRDLAYGVRTLRRSPGFAVASLLTLGLGIGAATAVFSVVDGVLLRQLPYPQADRIVRLYQLGDDGHRMPVSEPNFNDWTALTHGFGAMAEMVQAGRATLLGGDEAHLAELTMVSREFFDVLRVRPMVGRGFAAEEQAVGGVPAAIVSAGYWRQRLGGASPGTRSLRIGEDVYRVVGVMPDGFQYPGATEVWTPRELNPPQDARTAHNFSVVARLADGVALEAAQAELSQVSRALKARYGDDTWMADAQAVPLRDQLTASARPVLYALFGAASVLLIIACTNVSNLLLARAAARRRELGVRLAIGAGWARIARQLLAEALVLCGAGGAIGLALAFAGVRTLVAWQPGNLPRLAEVRLSWGALAFALGACVVTAALLGLATTLRARDSGLSDLVGESLRTTGSRGRERVREALVVTQVALTLVLLTGAGLLTRSLLRLLAVDTGYRTDDALVVDINMPRPPVGAEGRRQSLFQQELLGRLRSLPGVTEVGLINAFPLGGGRYNNGRFVEMTSADEFRSYDDFRKLGDAAQERMGFAGYRIASGGYFRSMSIPLIRGRLFEPSDGPDAPHVALISQSLAQAKWPGRDPIGRFVQFGNMDGDLRGFRVVGVVGDVRERTLEEPPGPLFYGSYLQRPGQASRFSLVMRGVAPARLAAPVRETIRRLDPELPVRMRTVTEALDGVLAGRRFNLLLIGVFSGAALVLATLGIYGLIAYVVAQRAREIGIRMALGAESAEVTRLIVTRATVLAALGAVVGVPVALMLARLIRQLLYEITAADPVTLAAVLALLFLTAVAASYVPAWRAARAAPVTALRVE